MGIKGERCQAEGAETMWTWSTGTKGNRTNKRETVGMGGNRRKKTWSGGKHRSETKQS